MSILIPILLIIHVFVSILMVAVVLMQRPRQEGLGVAFGGGMTENMFGAHTSHVLSKITVWLAVIFFVLTLLLAMLYANRAGGASAIQDGLREPGAPAAATQDPAAGPMPGVPGTGATLPTDSPTRVPDQTAPQVVPMPAPANEGVAPVPPTTDATGPAPAFDASAPEPQALEQPAPDAAATTEPEAAMP